MESNSSNTTTGIGFLGALTIAFVVLKLCNVINWSWWWVTSPLWLPLASVIVSCLIAAFVYVLCVLIKKSLKKRKKR